MDTECQTVGYEQFDAEKTYRQLDSGEIVWLIAVKADNSLVMYDTFDNPFVAKEGPPKPHTADFAFTLQTGHCGSMNYNGSIRQCKWKHLSGQMRCRRTLNSWPNDEGCS